MSSFWKRLTGYGAALGGLSKATVWYALQHQMKYVAWQKAYAAQPEGGHEFLGDLIGCELRADTVADTGGAMLVPGVDLHCKGGVLRVEFPAEGVARVRLGQNGTFPPPHSYAVVDPDQSLVARVHGCGDARDTSSGGSAQPDHLRIDGPGISVEVTRHPCRLTFRDTQGNVLASDAEGAGWHGLGVTCSQHLQPDEAVYGLGEKSFGLNRRGLQLVMWNRDPAEGGYKPGRDPIYQSTPFILNQRNGVAYGVLFDNTYRATFDLGATQRDRLIYEAAGGELCYYVFAGPGMSDVVARYTGLTGRLSMPPRWALGYHQSRWSYKDEAEVRRVADEMRNRHIPCDAIHFDIDYMDGYRVFTWDRTRFPDPPGLITDLRRRGLRTVAIVDPGVKVDPAYFVCREGLARDAFCKLPDGSLYVGPVWPGNCYFPDFTNAAVRDWWAGLYQPMLEIGVAGFWNDMNEPAVFHGTTFPDAVQHNADNGPTDHRALHNVYGQCMLQAAAEGIQRYGANERVLLISRSAFAGIQRYGITWTGDNDSTWAHLRLSIPIVLDMGLSGQAFTGPDVAGFSGDATPELLVRWTQMGAFLPFFRNHSAMGSKFQEPYAFGEPYEGICRRYIEWRYRMIPYTYTAFWQASETGIPVARPLALTYPGDRRVASMDDEFLYGDALLVAPILEPGATGRGVYLPSGEWYDFWTGEHHEGAGDIAAHTPLDALPLYVRAGTTVPVGPVMQYTDELVPEALELHLFAGDGESQLYEDDGHSMAYRRGESRLTRFQMAVEGDELTLQRVATGPYDPGYRGYDVLLRGMGRTMAGKAGPAIEVSVDGETTGWTLDPNWHVPRIAAGMFQRLEVRWA